MVNPKPSLAIPTSEDEPEAVSSSGEAGAGKIALTEDRNEDTITLVDESKPQSFLTKDRRDFISKICVNGITIIMAAAMASKFFGEFPTLAKGIVGLAFLVLFVSGLILSKGVEKNA